LLPPATEKVWNYLCEQPALAGFILGGGSALSLLIRHRVSEDLDFLCLQPRLPRQRLAVLCREAHAAGFDFKPNDDEAAIQEFAEGGLELHDYQQDFLVNATVKVSFFSPDEAQRKVFVNPNASHARVATLAELFRSKALVSAVRSKSRDWLDLYLLLRDHGFTIRDYRNVFEKSGNLAQCDTGLARLCSGIPQRGDEGYLHLLTNPPTLEDLKNFFIAQREKLEVELAAEAQRKSLE
jgi:DNA-binding transcriptional MerR regulator